MIKEAALITLSCTLFVSMGLADAIQETLRIRFRLLSCPKCITFWCSLLWFVLHGLRPLECVAVSFISAYAALWLSLIYDAVAVAYNYLYAKVSETDAAEDTETPGADAVS